MLASVASMIDQFNGDNMDLLEEMGYEVHVACNFLQGNTSSKERLQAFQEELKHCKREVYQLPIPRKISAIGDIVKSYKQLKKLIKEEKYDLVHCHSPIGGVIARLACRKYRKQGLRVIYTAHGFHFFKGASWKNWLIFYPIEKVLGRYTDVLITICNEDYQFACRKKMAKKIVYSPGIGIHTTTIENMPIDLEKRKELGIGENSKLVFSIGELNKNKNHEVILKAITKQKDVHYAICGKGELETHLKQLAEELGIGEKVHLLGFRTDAKEWLKVADIFAFPSCREGLPVSLMEAMAAGLPVVCSKIRGNTDLIDNEKGGYLCGADDIEKFAEAIGELIENTEKRKEMGQYNQNKVKAFDALQVRIVMEQVYRWKEDEKG